MHRYAPTRQPSSLSNVLAMVPGNCRKYVIINTLVVAFVLLAWIQINGGLVPKFLRPRLPFLKIEPDIDALVFFDVENDASKVKWIREVNSKEALTAAMKSNAHMLEADVILRGQGTPSQKLVPVMGQPPQVDSDLTLEEWLASAKYGSKGFKLDFSSIDSVEISLQKLKELNDKQTMKFPVWLHANVLQGPEGQPPKVDATRFFRTMKRLFPKCTLSLGWTTGHHTDTRRLGYSWDMVLDMYHLVKKWEIEDQPIVFQARLSYIRNSVSQLKWLCDNFPHSSLLVWQAKEDVPIVEDIMYVSYRFPPHGAYFDMYGQKLKEELAQFRHFSRSHVNSLVLKRDEVMFKPGAWLKMGFHMEKDSILASTEAIILNTHITYLVSKSHYKPTEHIALQGRVQFLNRKNVESEVRRTGLSIIVRPKKYAHFEKIVGIKCYLGVDGDIMIMGSNLEKDDFKKSQRITPGSIHCFRFRVVDTGRQVIFQVNVLHECGTLESVEPDEEVHAEVVADVPLPHGTAKEFPFIIKVEDNKRSAVIDELSIKYS